LGNNKARTCTEQLEIINQIIAERKNEMTALDLHPVNFKRFMEEFTK